MKFIARHLNLIGLLMFAAFGAAATGLYFQMPKYVPAAKAKASVPVTSAAPNGKHEGGCCGAKPVAAEQPAACPHLAAQAAKESSCCPKPAKP